MADADALLEVPVHGLGPRSLDLLTASLQVQQVIPGRGGYYRDWRVLAQLVLSHNDLAVLLRSDDPVSETLKLWPAEATVGQLVSALEGIERFDVLDDCLETFLEDCRDFIRRRQFWNSEPSVIQLTTFQAFVIHVVEDIEFVRRMVTKIEDAGMSLFVPARDFPAAERNYIYSLVEIMQNRCLKVIVVVSRAFTEDEEARTLLDNAERIHAQETSRKVIPIILEACQPVGLMISHLAVYDESGGSKCIIVQLRALLEGSVNAKLRSRKILYSTTEDRGYIERFLRRIQHIFSHGREER